MPLPKGPLRQRIGTDLAGVHLALNVFVATSLVWIVIRKWAGLNPIWAISAMLASSDPHVSVAFKHVRSRLINAVLGCATGLAFLMLGGSVAGRTDWTLPLALAVTSLISSYIVRVPVMWRQAPITAALIVASGIEHHSREALDRDRAAPGRGGPVRLPGGAGGQLAALEDLAASRTARPEGSRSAVIGSRRRVALELRNGRRQFGNDPNLIGVESTRRPAAGVANGSEHGEICSW